MACLSLSQCHQRRSQAVRFRCLARQQRCPISWSRLGLSTSRGPPSIKALNIINTSIHQVKSPALSASNLEINVPVSSSKKGCESQSPGILRTDVALVTNLVLNLCNAFLCILLGRFLDYGIEAEARQSPRELQLLCFLCKWAGRGCSHSDLQLRGVGLWLPPNLEEPAAAAMARGSRPSPRCPSQVGPFHGL